MADRHHGNMDISSQEKTFAGFIRAVGFALVVIVAVLLILTTRI
jgi:hypothetical protein